MVDEAAASLGALASASSVLAGLVLDCRGALNSLVGLLAAGTSSPGLLGAAAALGGLAAQLGRPAAEAIAAAGGMPALMGVAQPEGAGPVELLAASRNPDPASAAAAAALEQVGRQRRLGGVLLS